MIRCRLSAALVTLVRKVQLGLFQRPLGIGGAVAVARVGSAARAPRIAIVGVRNFDVTVHPVFFDVRNPPARPKEFACLNRVISG